MPSLLHNGLPDLVLVMQQPQPQENDFAGKLPMQGQGVFLLLLALFLASCMAWLTSPGIGKMVVGVIQGWNLIQSVDDSYRYFNALMAWQVPELYHWSFMLPAATVIDGFFASLFQDSMFCMRLAHGVLASLGIYAIYSSGRKLGISPWLMLASCLSLLLMPLFLAESISFYAESLLFADIAFVTYCYIHKKDNSLVAFTAIAPLIRPEGIFYLIPILLEKIWKKQFWRATFILLPGMIYGFSLWMNLPNLSDFMFWRSQQQLLNDALTQLGMMPTTGKSFLTLASTINLFWLIAGFAGLANKRLWPL